MSKYKESLIGALDFVKDSVRCLGCVGSCNECEYFLAIEKIENAIEKLGELVEKETNKPLEFEELKEGMQVWDNVLKKYIHILTIDFGVPSGGLIETENEYVPFEERRFYRKQVKE